MGSLPALLTILFAVAGAVVMVVLGLRFSGERPRSTRELVIPPALAFVVVAPVVYRSAVESAGDAPLMIGVVVGAVIGVWRGRELTPIGVPRGSSSIIVGGDRWGAFALAGTLLLEGVVATAAGVDSIGPLVGLVGAAAGQLIGWYVGVYGRARAERVAPAP